MPSVLFTRKCPSVNGYVNIDVLVGYAESYDADANRTTVTLTGVQIREREHHVGSVAPEKHAREPRWEGFTRLCCFLFRSLHFLLFPF